MVQYNDMTQPEDRHENPGPRNVEELAIEMAELNPKPVTYFTPDNPDEIMDDFFSGRRRNPNNATYAALDNLDFQGRDDGYRQILDEFLTHPGIPESHRPVYEDYISRVRRTNELMHQAVIFRHAYNDDEREAAKQRFRSLNSELYGDPNLETAASMIQEVLDDTADVEDVYLLKIRNELIELLPKELAPGTQDVRRLEPSPEAKQLLKNIVNVIYTPLLRHADEYIARAAVERQVSEDNLKLGPQDMAAIYQAIIDNEFPGHGWTVEIREAKATRVVKSQKIVVVPERASSVSSQKARGLVVHELGVHMLRSIIGEGADLIPMRFGLDTSADETEEGLARAMESVLMGDSSRVGYWHYLTAALLNSDHDFRETFDIMWRYKSLDSYLRKPSESVDDEFTNKQQKATFNFMIRSIRGTNELPWHSNLSYYFGFSRLVDYIEKMKGDPDLVTLLFMGSIDPTNINHLKRALNAKGRAA
jgi:hypothetical protein